MIDLYRRFGRVSFYLRNNLFWCRVRDRNMDARYFLLRIGKEN